MTAGPPRPGGRRRVEMTVDGAPVVLTRTGGPAIASGSTVAYTVNLLGRWIGWVYDERPWLGHKHGKRSWSVAWREAGDTAARWRSEDYRTRDDAVAVLVAVVNSGPNR